MMGRLVSRLIQLRDLGAQSRSYRFHTLAQNQVLEKCSETAVFASNDRLKNHTELLKSGVLSILISRRTQVGIARVQTRSYTLSTHSHTGKQEENITSSDEEKESFSGNNLVGHNHQTGHKVSCKDKISLLVATLCDLPDNKEAVYGLLDAWVAQQKIFPIGALKNVLIALEKEQKWHRYVQVIKWILSKGQGNTLGTYGQLIRALDMDHRAEEAHEIWVKKMSKDLHSVPWSLCDQMLSIYYRNNMFKELVKLFKRLEAFDRKPPSKSIVCKVTNAYECLGLVEESDKLLAKYESLPETIRPKKSKSIAEKNKTISKKKKK